MPELMRDVLYNRMQMDHRDGDELGGARRRLCWKEFILALRLHTWEEMKSFGFASYWSKSERVIHEKGDLRNYWRDISTDGDFLGPPPSYTLIRGLVLRLCHRMMAHNIACRSQAPKKVTSEALISGRQFVARLAKHFRLLTEERLQGLMVIVPALPIIDITKLEAPMAPGGGDEDEEMPQAMPPPPRTQGERISILEEEVHGMREALQSQKEQLDRMARDFSRFTTWTVTSLTRLIDKAGPRCKEIDEVGELSIIWNPMCIVVMLDVVAVAVVKVEEIEEQIGCAIFDVAANDLDTFLAGKQAVREAPKLRPETENLLRMGRRPGNGKCYRAHHRHDCSNMQHFKRSDESLVIPLDEIQIDEKLYFVEEPLEIMDQKIKQLKQSDIPIDKV
nr:putative reverse transcriptase domain-containing protein [Tanacetum cinerariifolium]